MIAPLLLLLVPAPRWKATFVSLQGAALYPNIDIVAAQRDRSAIGTSFNHGADWVTEAPLVVHRGRAVTLPESAKWSPVGYWRDFIAVRRPAKTTPDRLASIRDGKIRWQKGAPPQKLPPLQRIRAAANQTNLPFPRAWYKALYPDPNGEGPEDTLLVTWYRLDKNVEIGSGRYHLGPPDMKYTYAYSDFPVIRTREGVRPLAERVSAPEGMRMMRIQFVSPEGWIVVGAMQNGQPGLAWLERA
jgi:hypothetical protein